MIQKPSSIGKDLRDLLNRKGYKAFDAPYMNGESAIHFLHTETLNLITVIESDADIEAIANILGVDEEEMPQDMGEAEDFLIGKLAEAKE